MNTNDVLQIIREGIYVLLIVSAPTMLVALIVGLIVSLFQALTQIQEATLTFVPKVVTMMLTLIIALPFMIDRLDDYSMKLFERIANIE
jgi:flagellar biosynthesis protein FliQ